MIMTTKEIGDYGEKLAVKLLKKKHYRIVNRNLHFSKNELDIIALHKKDKAIVFVEVKTRSVEDDLYSPFGPPSSAVTKQKRLRTIKAARDFLKSEPKFVKYQPRFDVVEVYLKKETGDPLNINHIENAFGV